MAVFSPKTVFIFLPSPKYLLSFYYVTGRVPGIGGYSMLDGTMTWSRHSRTETNHKPVNQGINKLVLTESPNG